MAVETMTLNLATPDVYIQEVDAFPNSIVPVATAIPAFIGYTPRASYNGRSYLNKPVLIQSFGDYLTYFGAFDASSTVAMPKYAGPAGQYAPQYSLAPTTAASDITLGTKSYLLLPDPGTIYYLYNAIRLYFLNGGGPAYVCSVGPYGKPTGKPQDPTKALVNPNVSIGDLSTGLDAIGKETDPTILLCPDAALLAAEYNAQFMVDMIEQASTTGSRVAVLDVAAGLDPDPMQWRTDITAFRGAVGMNALDYGIAYYPFLATSVSAPGDLDYRNLGAATLPSVLSDASDPGVAQVLSTIKGQSNPSAQDVNQANLALQATSADYALLYNLLLEKANVLPPSPAMAGIYASVDAQRGVWKAPANWSVNAAVATTLDLTATDQETLNVDAPTGKSINAIRLFKGKGVLVWGARTLNGNNLNWRYVNVRRTMIMIEQSIKLAAAAYVFEPNDANTWVTVSSMISNFLSDIWKQGGLAGSKPEDAFQVEVGLGSTMTALDILNGRMNISVSVAVTHPAEFIVLTFSQMMQKS